MSFTNTPRVASAPVLGSPDDIAEYDDNYIDEAEQLICGGLGLGADVEEVEVARTLLNLMPCSIFVKDLDMRFVSANRTMLDTFNFVDRSEIVGLDDFDIHPADKAEVYATIDRQVMETGEPVFGLEEIQTRPDGSLAVNQTSKMAVRDRDGQVVGLMGFSVDVTDESRVSEALEVSEQRYALAARGTRDGIWDYDMANRALTFSPRCAQIFDIPVSTGPVDWGDLLERVSAEQTKLLTQSAKRAINEPDQQMSVELDITDADGQVRWISICGTVVMAHGRASRFVGWATDVTTDRVRESELRNRALHDDLTGLENRRSLLDALETSHAALLYLDLDAFKVVNDSLGHQSGDDMLIGVADRLRAVASTGATVYRIGGDEFAVLLPVDDPNAPILVAEQINDVLRDPFVLSGLQIYTTASIGIVHSDEDDARSAVDMLRDADIALYEAKAGGKARASVFVPSMRKRAEDALDLQMRIRRAVEQEEFELHYQPIIDTQTRQMVGVEALIRWSQPDGTVESPARFLPYLEETKLIVPVGNWVIDTACEQMAKWRRTMPSMAAASLSLNISRTQFDTPGLVGMMCSAIARHGLCPGDIVVEVTETAVTKRSREMRTCLDALRAVGLHVAIDDFGVGQSSLAALYDVPADILKIDRSFIERIEANEPEPIISAVLKIAHSLGMTTVAEGVENTAQADWLDDHGCDRLQGYLLARPMPAGDIPSVFDKRARASLTD